MRLPNDTQRLAIMGRTGSGKTVAGLWHLSGRDYCTHPWLLIDYKGDPHIDRIPGLIEIGVKDRPPKHAGLYVVRPFPDIDDDAINDMQMRVWENGKTGIFLDEGYMIGRFNTAYRALLTQGRSKRIPIITLSQRPAWISPFILSESEYFQVFRLQTPADQKRMLEYAPGAYVDALKDYHSYYFDVNTFELTHLKPVPKINEILDRFDNKRARKRWPI